MKLEFADGTQIEVRTIFGGQQHIQNAQRDVLTIEVDPTVITFPELKELFQDTEKTALLATVHGEERNEIGTDYSLYLSLSNELREIRPDPGVIALSTTEEVNIVKIAQLTYAEKYVGDNTELIEELEDNKTALSLLLDVFS